MEASYENVGRPSGETSDKLRKMKALITENPLLKQIDIKGCNILGDKAYGTQSIRDYISSQKATYTIPPQSNCNEPWPVDWYTYKERHLVGRFFQQLKWFRRILTRFDKLDASFLAFVYIAAIMVLLK